MNGRERRFFFSSRRRHTRWNCDWSSDVCSSDLSVSVWAASLPDVEVTGFHLDVVRAGDTLAVLGMPEVPDGDHVALLLADPYSFPRSEERRVGKECRSRWSPRH